MPDDGRPRSPAWLNTAGSPKARSTQLRGRHQAATPARRSLSQAQPVVRPEVDLSENARTVLERRYLAKDATGNVVESPEQLFRRVAHNIALAEAKFAPRGKGQAAIADAEERFYDLMTSLRFLPNSPTLGNAGRGLQQ